MSTRSFFFSSSFFVIAACKWCTCSGRIPGTWSSHTRYIQITSWTEFFRKVWECPKLTVDVLSWDLATVAWKLDLQYFSGSRPFIYVVHSYLSWIRFLQEIWFIMEQWVDYYDAHKDLPSQKMEVLMMSTLADPMEGEFHEIWVFIQFEVMNLSTQVNLTLKVIESPTFLKTKWFYWLEEHSIGMRTWKQLLRLSLAFVEVSWRSNACWSLIPLLITW